MDSRPPLHIPTREVVRILALISGFYVGVRLLWVAHPIVFLFFLGVLFGLPLAQGADWFEKRHVPRGLGVAIILTLFFGLLTAGGMGMAPILRTQSKELQQRFPEALDKIDNWLGRRANGMLGFLFVSDTTETTRNTATDSSRAASATDSTRLAPAAVPATVAASSTAATASSTPAGAATTTTNKNTVAVGGNVRHQLTKQLPAAGRSFLRVLTSTFAVSGAFVLVLFIAAYIGVDPPLYHGGILTLVPVAERPRVALTMTRLSTTLRRWLVTQLIAMLVIGAVTTLFLLSIRVKAAVPLGILAGISKFIPIVGSIFAAVPAVAMAFIDSPHKALIVALGYFVIQFLENHLLVPILMKRGIDLPPALTLGIQALMATLFGFLGLLVAVPLLAAVLTVFRTMSSSDLEEFSAEADAAVAATRRPPDDLAHARSSDQQ
ncbi:MAG TPA: AI-2E family transporter [Gemmatimonadaceae bacterium]|jgi:predicted PurR-regulated permease PerM